MTLDERLRFLQEQYAIRYCQETPGVTLGDYRGTPLHDPEWYKERQHHISEMAKFKTPAEVGQIRRGYKETDLKQVGFVSHMFIVKPRIIFYLCETESHASYIDEQLSRILFANPKADFYSYEQELCFFITRVDEPGGRDPDDQIPIGEPY